jgi:hypothetical protein
MKYTQTWNTRRRQWEVRAAGSAVVVVAFDKLYEAERWVGSDRADREAEAS